MKGYRPLTESEMLEQKADNIAGYVWIAIGTILGAIIFFMVSHATGLIVGAIIVFASLWCLDYSDMTETDSGTSGE